ncbi:WD domain-containing protein [Colletotrichum karsti]|uniref:Mitochondrial division protein 1 n=1 Tax=Colletotrichum karsti TaxID=1095194 RepID=A0A9P6LN13_9PEZI|nr:WD domain-containing protein [Colletotrichum karsti]KAF9879030.1 WD domain-containing protein [Colletotrichum karsti]
MPGSNSPAIATPLPEPPPKRRKVLDTALHRYSSPDELSSPDLNGTVAPTKPPTRRRRLSAQRAAPSMTPSRSPSDDELNGAYYSRSSRSRSRSRSRTRSPTASPRSRSRSRSASTSGGSDRSSSSSRRSLADNVDRMRLTPGAVTTGAATPTTPPPPPARKGPVRPVFEQTRVLGGHAGRPVSQVRISPDGRWIASASADGTVKVWDAETGRHMDTLVGHMAGVSCVAWSPDSGTLATGSDDKAIRLWDRVTGRPKATAKGVAATGGTARPMPPLRGHHNYVHCLAFSPRGNVLASGSYDEAVFLWDVRAGRLMRSLPAHSDPVSGIDFCCDGTLVVSCSTDGLIRIWDTYTGQCLRTLVHEDNPAVTSVCFSPNGRFVLAFNLDDNIRLWDYVDGSVKKTYQGHTNNKFAIGGCFGIVPGEGAFIASASEDGEIVLWDVVTKEVVQRIPAHHPSGKKSVCFWVDVHGDNMVGAGQDGSIRMFSRVGGDGDVTAAAAAVVTNGHVEDAPDVAAEETPGTEPPIKVEEDLEMGGT